MSYFNESKERAIAAQNAATAAATLLAGTGAGYEQFEQVRTAIYHGTTALADGVPATSVGQAVGQVLQAFPGAEVTEAPVAAAPAPAATGAPVPRTSNGAGSVVVNFGKYKGQTIEAIHRQDPSYIEFLKTSNNDFIRGKVYDFLSTLAAA